MRYMANISIKPEREYLREIASKINGGRYAIPVFQRDFVWKKQQVLDLFDSIIKGYPIGSIILWKPDGNFDFRAKEFLTDKIISVERPEFYVLDGRQRLTTFYGCITKIEGKKEALNISYNLEKECFEYVKGRGGDHIIPLPDLYDTLSLLNHLQIMMENISDKDRLETYIGRAKAINARLQSYEIGEVLIENCSLDEAGTVFSRINSKGTDISKVSMLQAIYFKEERSPLLSDEINSLRSSLVVYGFDGLRQDDILNCCCRYVGKNFYDSKIMEELIKNDITKYLDQIKVDITNAVKFLHDRCGVLSSKMLPYVRQLIGVAAFFKDIDNPTEEQLAELKKWFFYTTVNQSFLNGSLNNVRNIFRNLDKFIEGKTKMAMEYDEIELPSIDFRFSTQSALSNLLMITLAKEYKKISGCTNVEYMGQGKLLADSAAGVMLFFSNYDKQVFAQIYNGEMIESSVLPKYLLTENVIKYLQCGNINDFKRERVRMLLEAEKQLLNEVGLWVKE